MSQCSEAETQFFWTRNAQKGQGRQAGEGRIRGLESLTDVINLYKGCRLSVYFTVMGLKS